MSFCAEIFGYKPIILKIGKIWTYGCFQKLKIMGLHWNSMYYVCMFTHVGGHIRGRFLGQYHSQWIKDGKCLINFFLINLWHPLYDDYSLLLS